MMTTDNEIVHDDNPSEEAKLQHQNQTGNEQVLNGDSGKTQEQIDAENREALVKTEVSAPISESQVQPGREVVDGNGMRDTEPVEGTRPDTIVDTEAVTQSKVDALDTQQEIANREQEKQTKKLNHNTKPSTDKE